MYLKHSRGNVKISFQLKYELKCNSLLYKMVLKELGQCGKIIHPPKLFHLRILIKFRSLSQFLILICLCVLVFSIRF